MGLTQIGRTLAKRRIARPFAAGGDLCALQRQRLIEHEAAAADPAPNQSFALRFEARCVLEALVDEHRNIA
jgi:hypothetical protein